MSKQRPREQRTRSTSSSKDSSSFLKSELFQAGILFVLAFILYAQTMSFEYVLDDRMVMTENSIVQQGLAGIPTLLTKDSFYGYDEVRGRTGQRKTYRPLSFITFAMEHQIWGNSPRTSHALNVVFYGLTVVMVFLLLRQLLAASTYPRALPMMAALLFLAHPIHTEVVANVKSRDEILALLCAASSLLLLFRFHALGKPLLYAGSLVLFLCALLAKENMLPFVVIVPLSLYFFASKTDSKTAAKPDFKTDPTTLPWLELLRLSAPYFVLAGVYAVVWFGFIGRIEEQVYTTLLGNPFVEISLPERLATVTAIFSLYVAKAFYPTTLSIGYSYNQIPLRSWADAQALLGLVMLFGGGALAFILARKRHIISFCILFFACMLAVTSNFFIYAGGLLGERFLFTPSVVSVLALAWLLVLADKFFAEKFLGKKPLVLWGMLAFVFVSYSAQTLARTKDWKSDLTLFRADVVSTPQSFNMHQGYAKELIRRAPSEANPILQRANLDSAAVHLRRALEIYPAGEAETFSALGNYFDLVQNYDSASFYARKTVQIAPQSQVYRKNLAVIYSNKGVDFAQARRFADAVQCFKLALPLDSANAVLCANIGGAFAAVNERDSAITYLQRAIRLDPMLPSARANLQRLTQARGN
jgi:Tfp pilus assembly protein PilF